MNEVSFIYILPIEIHSLFPKYTINDTRLFLNKCTLILIVECNDMHLTWEEVLKKLQQARSSRIEHWLNEVVFTLEWWLLLIVTVVLLTVWLIILDKTRIFEIVTYGLMVSTIGTFGDTIGLSLLLWEYPIHLLHTSEIIEIHNMLMPILYMIVYQYFEKWKPFFIAAAISAFTFAFILEPLLVWLGIYELYSWKFAYSVIPYFLISVGLKWLINKFKQMDRNYQHKKT